MARQKKIINVSAASTVKSGNLGNGCGGAGSGWAQGWVFWGGGGEREVERSMEGGLRKLGMLCDQALPGIPVWDLSCCQ